MSPTGRSVHTFVLRVAIVSLAALALSACGTSTSTSAPHVVGVPSIGISVPLQSVACTRSDSCVAVGTQSASIGPTSVAQYRLPGGRWAPIGLPPTTSPSIDATSCWRSACLVAGASSNGDLVWRYDGMRRTVSVAAAPSGGLDVSAIDCYSSEACALVDIGASATARLSFSVDGAVTWTTPVPISLAPNGSVTAISCVSSTKCMVASTSSANSLSLLVTSDAGATWTTLTTPSTWQILRSVLCRASHCVALVTSSNGSRLVRTSNFGGTWRVTALAKSADAMACTSLQSCVVVGQQNAAAPWLALIRGTSVEDATTTYVPSPLVDVACGTTTCAAIGVTTVVALKP